MNFDVFLRELESVVQLLGSYLSNPQRRTYVVYLLSAGALAYFWFKRKKIKGSFWRYIFNRKVWLSSSAKVDYKILTFNSVLKVVFIGPYLILGLYLSFYTREYLLQQFGYPTASYATHTLIITYSISLMLLNDFTYYLLHLAFHKLPWLWEFHKVHHSATSLNPFTQYRIHPIELFANNARSLLIFGLTTGVFEYFSGETLPKLALFGIPVFGLLFMFTGANLRHSHVPFRYPPLLERIFISPRQHQIHHSKATEHYDKNMGSKLAIWDWLFGTLVISNADDKLKFGIDDPEHKFSSLRGNLGIPFKNMFYLLKRNINKLLRAN